MTPQVKHEQKHIHTILQKHSTYLQTYLKTE